MQGFCEPFKGKKITLMGLGVLGRGVGDAEFLAGCGAQVLVTDKKSEVELAEPVARLKKFPNVSFRLGGHKLEDFTNADMVIKAAGVPLDSPEIAAAQKANVPVYMSTALFAKYAAEAGAIVVGVTGTRGKTTVSQMIFHTLRTAGEKVLLGGNVRGLSTLAMLPQIEKGDLVVLELDSWQLQGFGDLKISPHVAVFTNLMPDHMNYYAGDMEKYFADKANIFTFQRSDDFLFVGKEIEGKIKVARPQAAPQVPHAIPTDWELNVIGEHNRENAALAAAALEALDLSDVEIHAGFASFQPVEGRLQFLREVNGAKIYNDNNSTTPEATIAALRALGDHITLICGGSEKELDLKELVQEIRSRVLSVILLVHPNYKGSGRLAEELRAADIRFEEAHDMKAAFELALKNAQAGVILFSPAFASFGMFKNEYDRNDQFVRLVQSV